MYAIWLCIFLKVVHCGPWDRNCTVFVTSTPTARFWRDYLSSVYTSYTIYIGKPDICNQICCCLTSYISICWYVDCYCRRLYIGTSWFEWLRSPTRFRGYGSPHLIGDIRTDRHWYLATYIYNLGTKIICSHQIFYYLQGRSLVLVVPCRCTDYDGIGRP